MPLACMIQGVCLEVLTVHERPQCRGPAELPHSGWRVVGSSPSGLCWSGFSLTWWLGWEQLSGKATKVAGWDTLGICLHNSHTHSRLLHPLGHSLGSGPL